MIKEKWHSIGQSLKIANERLKQFEGLSDPLLEVIIHWWKGTVDTLLSWDTIVSVLKDPVIQENDVAKRIERVYCIPSSEEIAFKENGRKALSGKLILIAGLC